MLNIVASFFRPTIPPSKDDVLQQKYESKEVKHANERKRSANEIIL